VDVPNRTSPKLPRPLPPRNSFPRSHGAQLHPGRFIPSFRKVLRASFGATPPGFSVFLSFGFSPSPEWETIFPDHSRRYFLFQKEVSFSLANESPPPQAVPLTDPHSDFPCFSWPLSTSTSTDRKLIFSVPEHPPPRIPLFPVPMACGVTIPLRRLLLTCRTTAHSRLPVPGVPQPPNPLCAHFTFLSVNLCRILVSL